MMDSCLRLVSVFLILRISLVCTAEINIKEGFLNWSETYAPQSVKRRDTAQVFDRRSPVSVSTSGFNKGIDLRAPSVAEPVVPPSTCHQRIPLRFDSVTEGFVFSAASRVRVLRPLTNEEILSIQRLKMKSG